MKRLTLSIIAVLFSGIAFAGKSQEDMTPQLFKAVENGKKKQVKKLLSKNVQVNGLNSNGQTPLDVAVDCGATKIAAELMKHGAKVTSEEKAVALRQMFKMRAAKFFVGTFFVPFLWIGSIFAVDNMSYVTTVSSAK